MKKRKNKIWKYGPFTLYRCVHEFEKTESLDISVTKWSDEPWGWEWGYRDPNRGMDRPNIELRFGKLIVLYFEKFKKGFELWILGFWWIK